MARQTSLLTLVIVALLGLPNHQATVFPYHQHGLYHYFRAQPYVEPRFNFLNLRDVSSVLLRTTVTSASTTFTFTASATCTKMAAVACVALDASTDTPIASKVPFPTGYARSLPDAKEVEFIEPSQVLKASIETTKLPEARMFHEGFERYHPYAYDNLYPSFAREIPGPGNQGRFLFSTTTITVFGSASSVTTTTTRTLTPGCSAPNYFTECP